MTTQALTISTNDLGIMADAMAKGGLFGFKNKEQAFSLMLIAQAQGQHPATIVQDYHIFSTGKAGLKSDTVLARFQDEGGTIEWLETSDTVAKAKFSHPKGGQREFSWTIEEARRANLLGKDVWKAYPSDMLRARCIFRGVRAIFPKVFGGMYGREEVEDMPTDTDKKVEFQVISHEEAKPDLRAKYEGLFAACHTVDAFKGIGPLMAKDGLGSDKDAALTGLDATETWKALRTRHWVRINGEIAALGTFVARVGAAADVSALNALIAEHDQNPLIADNQPCIDALAEKAKELGVVWGEAQDDGGLPE